MNQSFQLLQKRVNRDICMPDGLPQHSHRSVCVKGYNYLSIAFNSAKILEVLPGSTLDRLWTSFLKKYRYFTNEILKSVLFFHSSSVARISGFFQYQNDGFVFFWCFGYVIIRSL